MAQNLSPPPASDTDEIFEAMEKLLHDSQVVRSGHFIAAERQDRKLKTFTIIIVVLNVLIASGLVETTIPDQKIITIKLALRLRPENKRAPLLYVYGCVPVNFTRLRELPPC